MNPKIKKVIAREGLVFLGILIIGILTGNSAYKYFWEHIAPQLENSTYFLYSARTLKGAILSNMGYLYIAYLCIWLVIFVFRFIIWAIKTLTKRV